MRTEWWRVSIDGDHETLVEVGEIGGDGAVEAIRRYMVHRGIYGKPPPGLRLAYVGKEMPRELERMPRLPLYTSCENSYP
ncbi:MAG: hypothetical protein N3E38_02005 [Candidatus Aenigmarchaeota archaeon]|nr:hypothetical protein [Candidatus Aenigmarchaeota archaeon]